MVRESFRCQSGKNTTYCVVLSRENTFYREPPTWTQVSDIFSQPCFIPSHPKPQIRISWNMYIYVHVPFKLRPQKALKQPVGGVFSPCPQTCECEEAKCLSALTHICTWPPLLSVTPSPSPPCGYNQKLDCWAYSRVRCLKQSVLSFWTLIYTPTLLNPTYQQTSLWSWGPFPKYRCPLVLKIFLQCTPCSPFTI